jgi:hypothetical protein
MVDVGGLAVLGGGLLFAQARSGTTRAAPSQHASSRRSQFIKRASSSSNGTLKNSEEVEQSGPGGPDMSRHRAYCRTNLSEKFVLCDEPVDGNRQVRTSFSMHFATDDSSPVALTFCALPSPPTVSITLTLTAFLLVGFRSQQTRPIAVRCAAMTCCT